MKRFLSAILILALLGVPGAAAAEPLRDNALKISAPSAVLMEKETGELLYEKGAHERRPPASVTKVMTLLLIIEDVESGKIALDDIVTASERAASFGGSCVYLEEGEQMSVDEMLKCIAVVSANDCAVAMAEHLSGSEEIFVERMNRRAGELGMADSHFTNCTGLFEDPEHYTTAYDIALMSRELVRHELAKRYTTIWMDSIRGGAFGLSNTNKLVYWYPGCTGLKTGFTSEAMYCLAASAERDGVEYVAVIMHGDSIESRNADAKALLNYAFANFTLAPLPADAELPEAAVDYGARASVPLTLGGESRFLLVPKGGGDCAFSCSLPDALSAPVAAGESAGELIVTRGGEEIARRALVAAQDVERIGFWGILARLAGSLAGL
ncbi:MAG: D-alanyl-D-alanine carboxypeptidase [Oscillospiraceae bacterium]|nr:D-alanyl-D-alanine carboxypeptidase [Oscillospiraceae bacterium]